MPGPFFLFLDVKTYLIKVITNSSCESLCDFLGNILLLSDILHHFINFVQIPKDRRKEGIL